MRWLAMCLGGLAMTIALGVAPREAQAVTCAKGVYRAGCVGPNGAAVVRRPPATVCRYVFVNGVRVRRCG